MNGSISFPLIGHVERNKAEGIYKTKPFGGLKVSYLYSTSYRFAVGMEFGANFMNVFIDRVASTSIISNNGLYLDFKGMDIGTYSFVPKFRWKTKKNNKISGIYHEFGAGLTLSKPIKREYGYENTHVQTFPFGEVNPFSSAIANDTYDPEQLYDYSHKPYIGLLIMYDLSYKGEITKNLLWSIGLRAQLNLSYRLLDTDVFTYKKNEKEYFWISKTEMDGVITRNRFRNPFTLNFGLVYNL